MVKADGDGPVAGVHLSAGRLRVTLLPRIGGGIGRFDWIGDGETYPILRCEADPQSPLEIGCFPLVPYCNRIRGGTFRFGGTEVRLAPNMPGDPSPLHGHGWLRAWTVAGHDGRNAELVFDYPGGEWPWRYEARQRFALDQEGLSVELSCSNRDDGPMPCGLGFHPYFPCTPQTRLTTRVDHVWTVDELVLPVARIPAKGRYDLDGGPICGRDLDNGYDGWSGKAMIASPLAPVTIALSSPDARFFQLYSPGRGGLFVAEPVSHANAALNAAEAEWPALGQAIVAPGETMTLRMRLDISSAAQAAMAGADTPRD